MERSKQTTIIQADLTYAWESRAIFKWTLIIVHQVSVPTKYVLDFAVTSLVCAVICLFSTWKDHAAKHCGITVALIPLILKDQPDQTQMNIFYNLPVSVRNISASHCSFKKWKEFLFSTENITLFSISYLSHTTTTNSSACCCRLGGTEIWCLNSSSTPPLPPSVTLGHWLCPWAWAADARNCIEAILF